MSKFSLFIVCFCLLSSFSSIAEEKENAPKTEQKQSAQTQPSKVKKLYRVVDKNGNISYSDQPSPGSKVIAIDRVQNIKMTTPKVDLESLIEENEKPRDPNAKYYQMVGFAHLKNDGVVRNNAGTVPLTAVIDPNLSKGHYVKFYIDGQLIQDKQKELSIIAENIGYGPHTAHIEIVSGSGSKVQDSVTVNFNLLHIVRKKVGLNNRNTQRGEGNANSKIIGLQPKVFKIDLPEHPKVPTYESMKKTDN